MHATLAASKLVLAVGDPELRASLMRDLGAECRIRTADSPEAAGDAVSESGADAVLIDLGSSAGSEAGLAAIDAVRRADPGAKIVAIGDEAASGPAREALRRGACDFLERPFAPSQLAAALERAVRLRRLEGGGAEQGGEGPSWTPVPDEPAILGESEAMRGLSATLRRLAGLDVNVLITGESGTGKDLCARLIHESGPRARRPFVPVHCGAIPESLLESELFGHARGAFSGAEDDKPGLIETAHRGTLFLDEIGDMPAPLQVKLLRFLQDLRVQRLGENKSRVVDARVLAATNRPVLTGEGGALRGDLYYRLSEFEVRVPPLRERGRDVLLLAGDILERNRRRFGRPRLRLSARAEKALLAHGWPGNVRELENRLNRASITAQGDAIEEADLELDGSGGAAQSYREARKAFEKELLLNALRKANGNVSLAARTVGVTRPTFYDMMRKTGIWVHSEAKIGEG